MIRSAIIEGEYRYRLSRDWDRTRSRVLFVMLNPSTADHVQDDPTIRRCIGFAKHWGHGALDVCNLFALRSTDPRVLSKHPAPVGPDNDERLLAAARNATTVVAAWGTGGAIRSRGREVRALLASAGVFLHALRITKHGEPAHPLYLPGNLLPVVWRWEGA